VHTNNTFLNTNHPKLILNQIKTNDSLPFKEIFSAEKLSKSFENCNFRDRFFPPDVTLLGFLSQALNEDKSCQAAVARILAFYASLGKKIPSANTAAYAKARSRLPEIVISNLAKESAEQLEEQVPPHWLWRERHIKLIDGSTLFMPDTQENQATYPQSKSQKAGLGFPISRIVAIISYATGAVLDLAIGPCFGEGAGEHTMLRQLMHQFKKGDIVLGDCYYASFFLIATLIQLGVDAVFPIHNARKYDFRKGKRLEKKDHIVEWQKPVRPKWMTHEEYITFPKKISIREVEIQDERKGFRSKSRIIVSTFLEQNCISKNDFKNIYDYRWSIEVDLRSIKDTMRMGILRGKTPLMVRKEIWAHILAYNLIRKIMSQSAYIYNKNPRELSFKLALQIVEAFRQTKLISENNELYLSLLKAIAYKKVSNRFGRREPRRLKRRPKNCPLLLKPRKYYH
jgi:hypothetical protein